MARQYRPPPPPRLARGTTAKATTMQNAKNTATTTAKAKATAPAPAPVAQAPMAPLFTFAPYSPATGMGWPAKAQSGASVRAYCAKVAQALAKAQPNGFTLAQYATALCVAQAGTTYRLPANGFGTGTTPNATARQHATWFANTGRYLVPATAPSAPAPATTA